MDRAWKWKIGGVVFLVLLSVYALLPTILGIQEQRETLRAENKPAPFYFGLLPEKGLNLGLDLRGGIYTELEINLEDALFRRVNITVQELVREAEKKNQAPTTWDLKKDLTLVATFSDPKNRDAFSDRALKDYQIIDGNAEYVFERHSAQENPISVTLGIPDRFKESLKKEVVRQAVQSVRNRIDRYGLAEPTVQRQGENRIVVELPGIKDPGRALNIVQQAGVLEFKLVDARKTPVELSELIRTTREKNNQPVDAYGYEDVKKLNEWIDSSIPAGTEVAFELVRNETMGEVVGANPHLLDQRAYVTGDMLQSARVDYQNNEPYVSLTFNNDGAKAFGDLTKAHVKEQLAILLDGNVHSAPVIREPILTGQAQIDLGYGNRAQLMKEAQDLTLILQEGALPARLTVATKTVVGPSLGKDSIEKSLNSLLFGLSLVVLFMVIYYRWSGFLANAALLFNTLFIFALLAMFQATLTLPGMAGIVLSIGMAVDANVLIFERIREEIAQGQAPRSAIANGYGNAMRAILDSNITTVLAAAVLYQFGTGPIRGFAVTLMMGITCSMFTAIVMTRLIYEYFLTAKRITRISV